MSFYYYYYKLVAFSGMLYVCVFGVVHMHTHSVLYKLNTSIDRLALQLKLGLNAAISSVPSSSFLYEMFHIDPRKKSIGARESVFKP